MQIHWRLLIYLLICYSFIKILYCFLLIKMSMYKCSFQIHTQFQKAQLRTSILAKPCNTMGACDRTVESFFFILNSSPSCHHFLTVMQYNGFIWQYNQQMYSNCKTVIIPCTFVYIKVNQLCTLRLEYSRHFITWQWLCWAKTCWRCNKMVGLFQQQYTLLVFCCDCNLLLTWQSSHEGWDCNSR